MSFDELMDRVRESSSMPSIARDQLPRDLSDNNKEEID